VKVLVAIAAAALLLRLAPLLQPGDSWTRNNDSPRYVELASGLRAGCGFARLDGGVCGPSETLRTPGYPLFLTAVSNIRTAIAAQAVLGAVTCFIVGYFAATRWGIAAGAAAEIFLALDIPSIVSGAMVMSDSIFQLLLTLGILLEMIAIDVDHPRFKQVCIVSFAGLSLGAAILVRPIGLVLPTLALLPFVVPTLSHHKLRLDLAAIVFFIPVVVGLGWAGRNYERTGMWTLSTIGIYNLYAYRVAGVIWYSEGGDFDHIQETLIRDLDLSPSQSPREIDAHMDHQMVARSLKVIAAHPFEFVRMSLVSMLWLAVIPDRANLSIVMSRLDPSIPNLPAGSGLAAKAETLFRSPAITSILVFQLALIFVVWVGVIRALVSPVPRRGELFVLVFIALTMLALASGPEAGSRYRTPAIPFLAIAAGVGWFRNTRRAARCPN
jgi:4-amino-4-deoxy-L-arabinose transferase-like glycosyltransferase